jgi:hypothetical protein
MPCIKPRSSTTLDGAEARAVVPAAAHGQQQPLAARKVYRGDDVGDILGAHNERRVLVDHRVVDHARVVIARITGSDDHTAQGGGKAVQSGPVDGRCSHDGGFHAGPPSMV